MNGVRCKPGSVNPEHARHGEREGIISERVGRGCFAISL